MATIRTTPGASAGRDLIRGLRPFVLSQSCPPAGSPDPRTDRGAGAMTQAAHDRLRPASHGGRKKQGGDYSLPHALRGAGNLRPFVPSIQTRSISSKCRLTYLL